MLHFFPIAPSGHVESVPNVHFCEHTGCATMSNVPVHTALSHSVEVSLGVTHAAPNVRGAGPPEASTAGGESPEHAVTTNNQASKRRFISETLQ